MTFQNKFSGRVRVFGQQENDLAGRLSIRHAIDLPANLKVRRADVADVDSSVLVMRPGTAEIFGRVQPAVSSDLPGSLFIRPHNRMRGLVTVTEPPVVVDRISPVEDTHVREGSPKINYGGDHDMFVGKDYADKAYESYLRFALSSIPNGKKIKRAYLDIQLLNSQPAQSIGIYAVPAEGKWSEYGTTWDNKPASGTLIKSFDSGTYAGELQVDLTSYVQEWYAGSRSHNGFALRSLSSPAAGRFKQFGTREGEQTILPILVVEYFDPLIYSVNRRDLPSSVFVMSSGESDLIASVRVKGRVEENDLAGSVTVRDPYKPVADDLAGSVYVRREALDGSVMVYRAGQKEIGARVFVRYKGQDDLEGRLYVRREVLPATIEVSPYADLLSSIEVKGFGEQVLPGSLYVRREALDSSVRVTPYADLTASIYVKGIGDSGIVGSLYVRREVLESTVTVSPYNDLPGSLRVRAAGKADILGSLYVRREALTGSVYVTPYTDLPTSLQVRALGNDDIFGSVFAATGLLKSTVHVRVSADTDLPSSVHVKGFAEADLASSVGVRVTRKAELDSSVWVRLTSQRDLPATVIPRLTAAADLPTKLSVEISKILDASVSVRVTAESDLTARVSVRRTDYVDTPGSIEVRPIKELPGEVLVVYTANKDLPAKVISRQTGNVDLVSCVDVWHMSEITGSVAVRKTGIHEISGRVSVRAAGAGDLISSVRVGGYLGYAFIM